MTLDSIVLSVAGLFIAGVIKGVTGIGYTTAALPFLVMAVGMKPAMAIVLVPAIASNAAVFVAIKDVKLAACRFWPFYLGIFPGILIGAAALHAVDGRSTAFLLGACTLVYVALAWMKPQLSLPPQLERPLGIPAGVANGIVTGLTGSQIIPLMPYFMSLRLPRDEQVQAINLAVMIASVVLGGALIMAGIMTPLLLALSLAAAFPAILGVSCGANMRAALEPAAFRRISLTTLAMLSLPLILGHAPDPVLSTRPPHDRTTAASALNIGSDHNSRSEHYRGLRATFEH